MAKKSILSPSEEHVTFYHHIGLAVTQWQFVEQMVCDVAATAFATKDRPQLVSAFFAIENFRSKLAFAEQAIAKSPKHLTYLSEWLSICQFVQAQSAKRNELAHGSVVVYPHADEGRRYSIAPRSLIIGKKKPRNGNPPPGSLCVRDIDLIRQHFSKAYSMLMSLHCRLTNQEDHVSELSQREPQCLSLDALVRQMPISLGSIVK